MDTNLLIRQICQCLELLGSCDKSVLSSCATNSVERLETSLKANVDAVKKEVKNNSYLQEQISLFMNPTSEEDSIGWNFVEWCLSLLIMLRNILQLNVTSQEVAHNSSSQGAVHNRPSQGDMNFYKAKEISLPNRNILSIKQEKIILKTLQFITGIGIIPNLLPGVGLAYRNSEVSDLVKYIHIKSSPWKKHCQLVACVTCLLFCCKDSTLGSLILTHHLSDLLAALFQLCHAPIKKLDLNKEKSSKDCVQSVSVHDKLQKNSEEKTYRMDSQEQLIAVMKRVNGDSEELEHHLITQMLEDRRFLTSEFNRLMQKIYRPLFIQELILLLGVSSQKVKGSQVVCHRSPLWLRKVCSEMLTDCLLQKDGVLSVVQAIFEMILDLNKSTDKDEKSTCHWKRCESIAKLIARVPAKLPSVQAYYEHIFPQIMTLANKSEADVGACSLQMACCIMSYMLEEHPSVARVVFGSLFQPLNCRHFERPSDAEELDAVKKDEVERCVNTLHKIFMCVADPNSPLLQELHAVYFPLYQLLLYMPGIQSPTRDKMLDLLVTLHKSCDVDTAVILLNMTSFEEAHTAESMSEWNRRLSSWNFSSKSEDLLTKIQKRFQIIEIILNGINSVAVKGSFVISLLKRLTSSLSKIDENSRFQSEKETPFWKSLLALTLLDSFSEDMENILLQNKSQAISFVKEVLNYRVELCKRNNFEEEMFGEKTLLISLNALEILVSQKEQMEASNWNDLKQCLPDLDCLISSHPDSHVKALADNLKVAIATHSTVKVTDCKEKSMTVNFETNVNTHNLNLSAESDTRLKELHGIQMENEQLLKAEKNKNPESMKIGTEQQNSLCNSDDNRKGIVKGDSYQSVLQDLHDPLLPARGHALVVLRHLILKRDPETLHNQKTVLKILQENLEDSDTYIYLSAIQGLVALGSICTDYCLPVLAEYFISSSLYSPEVRSKLGEALLRISQNLGSMISKYRDVLINAFLICAKDVNPQIRTSSISNLGQVCKQLKFGLGLFLQEILHCSSSLIMSDQAVEVRRASGLLITLILQGVGIDAFKLMESQLKDLYRLLKLVHSTEKDDVTRLHAQIAMEEINNTVKNLLCPSEALVKHIKVLDRL